MTVKMQLKYGSWTCFQVSKGSCKNYMSISKLTEKRTKIRPKTNDSKKARLILSAYHIRFVWFIYLFIFFLISFYVVNIIRCRWPHELPITYHSLFLWSRSPLHTVALCTLIWSIPEKVAQSLSKNSPKQYTPKLIMPRQQAWWYRSTIWREKRKANIIELCSFPILKII